MLFDFRSYPESDDCEKTNSSASDAKGGLMCAHWMSNRTTIDHFLTKFGCQSESKTLFSNGFFSLQEESQIKDDVS